MTLGKKGLTSGAIKGLTVCCTCSTLCAVLLGRHAALYLSAVQRYKAAFPGLSPVSFINDHRVVAGNRQPPI
ncbi:unnamed protein product, partial [Staurois parvus]